jgi:tetratricopeptide (TPR) repeat protein
MRPPVVLLACAAALFACAAAPVAFAQAKKPPAHSDPRLAEAKRLFEEGAAAYAMGNYDQAIKAWEKSYEISQKPLIFESIANAWERLGDARKARDNLSHWRDSAPPEELGLLDARIKNLNERVAREDEALGKAAADKAVRDAADAKRQADAEAGARRPWLTGAIVGGVGGVALIAGIAVDIVANSKRPAPSLCKVSAGLTLCNVAAEGPITQSNRLAIAGDATWIVGAAAVAAGVALVLVRRPLSMGATVGATPKPPMEAYLAPTAGGVVLGGRF